MLGEHVETVVEFYEANFYFPWETGLAADRCEIKELLVEIVIHLQVPTGDPRPEAGSVHCRVNFVCADLRIRLGSG